MSQELEKLIRRLKQRAGVDYSLDGSGVSLKIQRIPHEPARRAVLRRSWQTGYAAALRDIEEGMRDRRPNAKR